ncbi:MAG: FecR domain-containing protein [Pseudomonadota bacterium]|nr:FecR domain-containing protein [Pseudomonadota bacterium]
MTANSLDNLPSDIIDQAISWAVVLSSGTDTESDRADYQTWLGRDERHAVAMERLALLDRDFDCVRGCQASKVLDTLSRQRGRKRRMRLASGGILSLVLLFGSWLSIQDPYHWRADYVTDAGEFLRVDLPHGALLYLDGESAVNVEDQEGRSSIRLLAGTVLVDSHRASENAKPQVLTSEGRFRPLGTRFEVRRFSNATALSVLEGRVEAAGPHGDSLGIVKAGEQKVLRAGSMESLPSNGLAPGAWAEGVVEADNARLAAVLDVLAHHFPGRLAYAPEVADIRVTGVFHLSDSRSALEALQNSLPITVDRAADWWVTVRGEQKGGE